jgi:hypothetical protein
MRKVAGADVGRPVIQSICTVALGKTGGQQGDPKWSIHTLPLLIPLALSAAAFTENFRFENTRPLSWKCDMGRKKALRQVLVKRQYALHVIEGLKARFPKESGSVLTDMHLPKLHGKPNKLGAK